MLMSCFMDLKQTTNYNGQHIYSFGDKFILFYCHSYGDGASLLASLSGYSWHFYSDFYSNYRNKPLAAAHRRGQ